jgi:protein-tyrosine phosphatase
MNHLLAKANLADQFECDSAGTGAYHVGEPPDRRMTTAAQRRGIPLEGQARQFRARDFEQFDLILAMDYDNYRQILAQDISGQYRDKVRLMCEFATQHTEKEVPDPYYGGADGFEQVLDLLADACSGLLKKLT